MLISSINSLIERWLPQGSLRNRFIVGSFWSLTGAILLQGSVLVALVIAARILGKSQFGELSIIISTTNTLGIICGLALGTSVTKYVAEFRRIDPLRAGRIIGLSYKLVIIFGVITAIAVFVLAQPIATNVLNSPKLAYVIRLSCILPLLGQLADVQYGVINGIESFQTIARIHFLRAVLYLPLLSIGAIYSGVSGAIVASTIFAVITCILNEIFVRHHLRANQLQVIWGSKSSELSMLWKFSLPALLSNLMIAPVMWLGNTFLVNQPNGYGELGAFNATNQWRNVLLFLPNVVGQTAMPIMSSLFGLKNTKATSKILLVSVLTTLAIVGPIAVILVLARTTVMRLYGADYADHSSTLAFVAIASVLASITVTLGQGITASGRQWVSALLNLGWAIIFLVSSFMLTKAGKGADGLAISYLIAYSLHSLWITAYMILQARKNKKVISV